MNDRERVATPGAVGVIGGIDRAAEQRDGSVVETGKLTRFPCDRTQSPRRGQKLRRIGSFTALCALLLGCSSDPLERTGAERQAVTFGALTLQERFELDAFSQALVNTTGVLIPTRAFQSFRNNQRVCDSPTFCGPIDHAVPNFCSDADFFKGQSAVTDPDSCTAFLIGNNLFATAGHCIVDPAKIAQTPTGPISDQNLARSCSELALVMRWWADPSRPAPSNPNIFDSNDSFFEEHVYQCQQVLAHGPKRPPRFCDVNEVPGDPPGCMTRQVFNQFTPADDWAVFSVTRAVTTSAGGVSRRPLSLGSTSKLRVGDPVMVAGYPQGLPAKLDRSGTVKQLQTGWFESAYDARSGSSGGPVMDGFGVVHGIHVSAPGLTPEQSAAGLIEVDSTDPNRGNCLLNTLCEPGPNPCRGQFATNITNLINAPGVPQNKIRLSLNADFDGDGNNDTVEVSSEAGTIRFVVFFGDNTQIGPVDTGFPDLGIDASVLLGIGNFDGRKNPNTGFDLDDLVVYVNGAHLYFDGEPTFGLVPNAGLQPLDPGYFDFAVSDYNGDGFADLRATRNPQDMCFGGPNGLTTCAETRAMPTARDNDGKYLAVSGQGLSTIGSGVSSLYVNLPQGTGDFLVEIFDGDLGSRDGDVGPGQGIRTCFRLVPDGLKQGGDTNAALAVVKMLDTELPHGQWRKLFFGAADRTGAKAFSGNFFYRLDVFLAADCNSPIDGSQAVLNAFKVRSTGLLTARSGNFSFVGADTYGGFTGPTATQDNTVDTDYDGSFQFLIDVGGAGEKIVLKDADADIISDEDPATVGPFGPDDIRSPGIAAGANDIIRYMLLQPNGTTAATVTNPSGNFDEVSGVTDIEERTFSTNNVTGFWTWRWENVWTENNVQIWVPPASPVTYEIFSAPAARLPVSSARPVAFFQVNPNEVARLLPVTLGAGTQTIVVDGVERALEILSGDPALIEGGRPGKVAVCHAPPGRPENVKMLLVGRAALPGILRGGGSVAEPSAMAAVLAGLLAAKLNIVAASDLGENLSEALVYASTESVADVVAAADVHVVTGTNLCSIDATVLGELQRLARLLGAINNAEVTYHQFTEPVVALPGVSPSRVRPSGASSMNVKR